jgi:sodium transport system permease protein
MPDSFKKYIENSEKNMSITYVNEKDSLDSIKKDIYNGEADYLIVFETNFDEKVADYKSSKKPNLKTFYNPSEDYSNEVRSNFENDILNEYKDEILATRLGNAEYTQPYYLNKDNEGSRIVDARKATGKGLSTLIPFLISIFLFSGAMSVGLDSIAGEKERGTMATLLVTPVRRETIAFGKIISLGIIAIISTLSQFVGIVISMPFASMLFTSGSTTASSDVDLASLQYGFKEFGLLILIMITMAGLYVAIICTISIFAKSVKEAGTYMTPIYMVVMIAGVSTMFSNSTPAMWQYIIPIYGNIIAMKGLLTFETTLVTGFMTITSTIVYIFIFAIILKKMFNSEKIMFNA